MQRGKAKPTVADRDRGHAVPTANGAVRVPVELGVVVGVQIDKSWGDNEPVGVDHLGGVTRLQAANLGDLAVLNPQVCAVAGHPRAIDDGAASNNGIELWHGFPPLWDGVTRRASQ